MKKTICLLTCASTLTAILFLPGCTSTHPKFTNKTTRTPVLMTNGTVANVVVEERTSEMPTTSGFQSSQAIQNLKWFNGVYSGDQQRFGVEGINQTTDAAKFTDSLAALGALALQGMAAAGTGGGSLLIPKVGSGVGSVLPTGTTPPILVDPTTLGAATFKVTPNGDLYVCLPNGSCLLITSNNIAHTK